MKTETTSKSSQLIARLVKDVTQCIRNVATDALADVINKEVNSRSTTKKVASVNKPRKNSTPKRNRSKSKKPNENKNNQI
jgi:hypothetical protein